MTQKRYYANPGQRFKKVFKSRFKKNGDVEVVLSGKEDIYSLIQSNADSVDIHTLLARYKAGDLSALNKREALFIDDTFMPDNYFEAVNKVNDMKNLFSHLPTDIKQKYGNSADRFVAAAGSKEWLEDLNLIKKEVKDVKKDIINNVDKSNPDMANGNLPDSKNIELKKGVNE